MKTVFGSAYQASIASFSNRAAKASMALAFGIAALTTASHAVTVSVGGDDYDVSTISGSFEDNQSLLETQVWWNDLDLAESFATVVGDVLGLPNDVGQGLESPWFTYQPNGPDLVSIFYFTPDIPGPVTAGSSNTDEIGIYAIATAISTPVAPVPLPAGGLLLLTGLVGISGLRRRKKHSMLR